MRRRVGAGEESATLGISMVWSGLGVGSAHGSAGVDAVGLGVGVGDGTTGVACAGAARSSRPRPARAMVAMIRFTLRFPSGVDRPGGRGLDSFHRYPQAPVDNFW